MTQHKTDPIPFFKKNWVQNALWILGAVALYILLRPLMQGDVIQGQVPAIQTQSITGQPIDFSQIKQPTLIHIWATWCPICEVTNDGVEALAKDYPVISIATQSGDDAELLEYLQKNNMNPDIIVNDRSGSLMQTFGTRGVPANFVVDGQGNIQFVEIGFTTSLGLRLRLWWLELTQ